MHRVQYNIAQYIILLFSVQSCVQRSFAKLATVVHILLYLFLCSSMDMFSLVLKVVVLLCCELRTFLCASVANYRHEQVFAFLMLYKIF